VLKTLRSLVRSDYPAAKMRLLAVDDGSEDDTWIWLRQAAREFPDRLQIFRLKENRGKRFALYQGIIRAEGEVIVTVDSDSVVEPQTLRNLVTPISRDSRIGAVAGNVRVLNHGEGIIPKMFDVCFTYSFDFLRASESMVDTVLCTPGALSAYRRSVVLKVLPAWINQTFCKRPVTIGEDRAMTNLILREGFYVHFQRNAVVYTDVPTRFPMLCRMLLRWARSNIRETLVMTRFAFGRFRDTSALGARINLLLGWLRMTVRQLMLIPLVAGLLVGGYLFGIQLVWGAVIASIVPAAIFALRHRSLRAMWAFPYGVFSLLGLTWITPYALMTPHKNRWLTRRLAYRPTAHSAREPRAAKDPQPMEAQST
jgi:hyaluronan synthase